MADLLNMLLVLAVGYAALGIVVAVPIAAFGLGRIDPAAQGAPFAFRLLVLPGLVGLWPVMLMKWVRAGKGASQ